MTIVNIYRLLQFTKLECKSFGRKNLFSPIGFAHSIAEVEVRVANDDEVKSINQDTIYLHLTSNESYSC